MTPNRTLTVPFTGPLSKITLTELETFTAIARTGGFTAASALLNVSQPAVTQRIRRLEQHLDVKLVNRGGRRELLTPAGQKLCEQLDSALLNLSKAIDFAAIQAHDPRTVTVASSPFLASVALPRLVRSFLTQHPFAHVSLLDLSYDESLRAVENREAQLALLADVATTDLRFVSDPIATTEVVLAAPPTHQLANRASLRVTDLGGERIYLNHQYVPYFNQIVDALADSGTELLPQSRVVHGMNTVIGMVEAAMGLALVTRTVAEVYCSPGTAVLSIEGLELRRSYSLVQAARSTPSELVGAFAQHVARYFSTNYPNDGTESATGPQKEP